MGALVAREGFQEAAGELVQGLVGTLLADADFDAANVERLVRIRGVAETPDEACEDDRRDARNGRLWRRLAGRRYPTRW